MGMKAHLFCWAKSYIHVLTKGPPFWIYWTCSRVKNEKKIISKPVSFLLPDPLLEVYDINLFDLCPQKFSGSTHTDYCTFLHFFFLDIFLLHLSAFYLKMKQVGFNKHVGKCRCFCRTFKCFLKDIYKIVYEIPEDIIQFIFTIHISQ